MPSSPATVVDVLTRLRDAGVDCLLFGGWAEEAFGLCPPRPHADIDLLLPADSFQSLDRLLAASPDAFPEIAAKRFAHKRAFLFAGIMVEVTIVQQDSEAAMTWFWGDVRFEWHLPLAEPCVLAGHRMRAASPENLRRFRRLHKTTEPWRWREPNSLVYPAALSSTSRSTA